MCIMKELLPLDLRNREDRTETERWESEALADFEISKQQQQQQQLEHISAALHLSVTNEDK